MSRNAHIRIFRPGMGEDPELYVNHEDHISTFIEWYSRVRSGEPGILYITGKDGCGKSTFFYHVKNWISNKPNYRVLENLGMYDSITELVHLGRCILFECKYNPMTCGSILSAWISDVSSRYRLNMNIEAKPYLKSTNAIGESVEGGIGLKISTSKELSATVDRVSSECKRHECPVIVYIPANAKVFRDELSYAVQELVAIFKDRQIREYGFIINIEEPQDAVIPGLSATKLIFGEISIPEITLLLHKAAQQHPVKIDLKLCGIIHEDGIKTYKDAISISSRIENHSPEYISVDRYRGLYREEEGRT